MRGIADTGVDGDFRIYRRNRRETIPVIMPPHHEEVIRDP